MTFKEVRHAIICGLHDYMKVPVVLSSQVGPEQEPPFILYSATAPYIPDDGIGDYETIPDENENNIVIRREQATCTMSFTICSMNRNTNDGYVLGEDEALDLAEQAEGWFLHAGYEQISASGITVVDVSNVQERSFLQVDEEARRYGFDVTIRYVRADRREIGTIADVSIIEKGEET